MFASLKFSLLTKPRVKETLKIISFLILYRRKSTPGWTTYSWSHNKFAVEPKLDSLPYCSQCCAPSIIRVVVKLTFRLKILSSCKLLLKTLPVRANVIARKQPA